MYATAGSQYERRQLQSSGSLLKWNRDKRQRYSISWNERCIAEVKQGQCYRISWNERCIAEVKQGQRHRISWKEGCIAEVKQGQVPTLYSISWNERCIAEVKQGQCYRISWNERCIAEVKQGQRHRISWKEGCIAEVKQGQVPTLYSISWKKGCIDEVKQVTVYPGRKDIAGVKQGHVPTLPYILEGMMHCWSETGTSANVTVYLGRKDVLLKWNRDKCQRYRISWKEGCIAEVKQGQVPTLPYILEGRMHCWSETGTSANVTVYLGRKDALLKWNRDKCQRYSISWKEWCIAEVKQGQVPTLQYILEGRMHWWSETLLKVKQGQVPTLPYILYILEGRMHCWSETGTSANVTVYLGRKDISWKEGCIAEVKWNRDKCQRYLGRKDISWKEGCIAVQSETGTSANVTVYLGRKDVLLKWNRDKCVRYSISRKEGCIAEVKQGQVPTLQYLGRKYVLRTWSETGTSANVTIYLVYLGRKYVLLKWNRDKWQVPTLQYILEGRLLTYMSNRNSKTRGNRRW